MATLDDIIDEQNRIHAELERMAADDSTTEEDDGGVRDTLVKEWKRLDAQRAKITGRLEELNLIRQKSQEISNTEQGDDGGNAARMKGSRGPEFMVRKDPLADREDTQDYAMLPRGEVVSRAATLIEQHDKRHWLPDHRCEAATRAAQAPSIARHMLMYGADEYYEAFRDYVNDPTGPGLQRAAGALSLASAQGGFRMVAAA